MAADSDPTLRDAVLDLKTVRGDREFTLALDGDLAASEDAVAELLLEAIQAGLESEMIAQMAAVQGLTFELTQADLDICAGYPIHGHTPLEMSHDMHGRLRYQVNGVTAAPLIGDAVAESMPQLLGGVVTQFSDACGGAVEEAYYAGTQLAMRMVAHALIGTSDAG